ncbi:transposase [bacterium]|nr:transposase [bacterium]
MINWYDHQLSNGPMEGINAKIQLAKRRVRGYRNVDNFISMIYFIAGNLDFNYPFNSL